MSNKGCVAKGNYGCIIVFLPFLIYICPEVGLRTRFPERSYSCPEEASGEDSDISGFTAEGMNSSMVENDFQLGAAR